MKKNADRNYHYINYYHNTDAYCKKCMDYLKVCIFSIGHISSASCPQSIAMKLQKSSFSILKRRSDKKK